MDIRYLCFDWNTKHEGIGGTLLKCEQFSMDDTELWRFHTAIWCPGVVIGTDAGNEGLKWHEIMISSYLWILSHICDIIRMSNISQKYGLDFAFGCLTCSKIDQELGHKSIVCFYTTKFYLVSHLLVCLIEKRSSQCQHEGCKSGLNINLMTSKNRRYFPMSLVDKVFKNHSEIKNSTLCFLWQTVPLWLVFCHSWLNQRQNK